MTCGWTTLPKPTCLLSAGREPGSIEELRVLGIGTHLVSAAESRIRKRGLSVAQLDVELDNPRARALYERLGYREAGRRHASWDVQEADGSISRYETEVAMLRKDL
jgi:ribosomal protein S18 acetylase RimI-like enzyme